jgi:hypothetical protein
MDNSYWLNAATRLEGIAHAIDTGISAGISSRLATRDRR